MSNVTKLPDATPEAHFRAGALLGVNAVANVIASALDDCRRVVRNCTEDDNWHEAVHVAQQGRALNKLHMCVLGRRDAFRADDAEAVRARITEHLDADFIAELYEVASEDTPAEGDDDGE